MILSKLLKALSTLFLLLLSIVLAGLSILISVIIFLYYPILLLFITPFIPMLMFLWYVDKRFTVLEKEEQQLQEHLKETK